MRLKDKVAIVTGAGKGIGRAIAMRYAQEGARLILAEIDPDAGQAAERAVRESGGEASFVPADIACEDQIRSMVEATLGHFGRADILVNNAAILLSQKEGRAHELSNETWDLTMNVNLRGAWLCSKHVIPVMLRQGGGCIIFIGSRTALQGFTRLTAYSAAKGGIFSLMRAMAVDYAPDHIRVNAIVPGTTDTPMNAALLSDPEVRRNFIAKIPAGRLGQAQDIAGMAVFLASDEAEYCLGGVYMVDGGAILT